jgi:uncharacterized damage-inducible protein DinB
VNTRTLTPDPAYDLETQSLVGSWAAGLDDQLRVLRGVVAGLGVAELEWQRSPGHNTIGMLLAHLAIVEVYWIRAIAAGVTGEREVDAVVRGVLGIGMADDGIPLAAGGGHPAVLAGRGVDAYLTLLDGARAATHDVLRSWRDDELGRTCEVKDARVSRGWIVYHVLEHFSGHLGQIRVILRDLRSGS